VKRRIFLRGVAGAALAAPFLTSLQQTAAKAQDVAANPRRMVIFYTQNGCLTNRWFPKVEDGPLDAAALAGTRLEGLTDVVDKLLVPRGLAMFPKGQINGYFDPHDQGMGSKLTCAAIDPENEHWALGRSLDHVAADYVNPSGTGPLVLSVGNVFANVKGILSYTAAQEPYSPETRPTNVYSTLTGLFGAASGTTTPAPTEGDYMVAQGNSIIDLVREDLDGMRRMNMSQADQGRIDDWLDLLRQTEVQVVSAACNAENAAALGITDETVSAASGGGGMGGNFGGGFVDTGTAFIQGGDMMINLIALTMMCDANRSIILQWPGYVTFNFDGMTHEYEHHGLSHRVGSAEVGGPCVDGVIGMLDEIDTWYAGRYVKLVNLIESINEGEGTMLDNSAVMWLPELADGNAHNNNNLPIVIAGSAGGYLKTGVSVNLDTSGRELGTGNSEASCVNPGDEVGFNTGTNGGNAPLNKLYVTLLNALGATEGGEPIQSFGSYDSNTEGISDPGEFAALRA
jgi:hypothetical protein